MWYLFSSSKNCAVYILDSLFDHKSDKPKGSLNHIDTCSSWIVFVICYCFFFNPNVFVHSTIDILYKNTIHVSMTIGNVGIKTMLRPEILR